jgi:PAS domain S-box-containing protein
VARHVRNLRGKRDTEELFAAIVASSDDAIFSRTPGGIIASWNAGAERMFGYGAEEVVGQPVKLLIPEHRRSEGRRFDEVSAGESVDHYETEGLRKDGSQVWVSLTVSPVHDRAGSVIGASTIARDITVRRQSDSLFRDLLESAPDAMVVTGPDGAILRVNVQTERLFGISRDALVGQQVEMLVPERFRQRHPGHRKNFMSNPQARAMGKDLKLFALRGDGSEFPVEIGLGPLATEQGLLVSAAIRDITERKRVEDELAEAQAALVLRERRSAVGEMVTVIGHELRNPLGAVINLLFLARKRLSDHDDAELDGYLDRAESETNRAAALSEDLTAYMRERDPVIVPLDFGAVVDEVLSLTPPPPGIEVAVGDLGAYVQADRDQLVQMVTNLITNGYQAMPDGGLLRVTGTESDGFVEIAVEDSGAGIEPADAERLLDPFYTTRATGTGLGLAIVKRFAEGHHGTVSIENGPGGGARVAIRLPHAIAEATP